MSTCESARAFVCYGSRACVILLATGERPVPAIVRNLIFFSLNPSKFFFSALGRECYEDLTMKRLSLGLRSGRTLTQLELTMCSYALCFRRLWHSAVRIYWSVGKS